MSWYVHIPLIKNLTVVFKGGFWGFGIFTFEICLCHCTTLLECCADHSEARAGTMHFIMFLFWTDFICLIKIWSYRIKNWKLNPNIYTWAFTPGLILASFSVSIQTNSHSRQHRIYFIPEYLIHKGYAETRTFSWSNRSSICSDREATLVTLAVRGISLTRIERTPLTARLLSVDITCFPEHWESWNPPRD